MKTNKIAVLVAGVLIMLSLGIIYIWSVFKAPIMAYYNWQSSDAALVASIMLVAFVAGIVFGGRIQDKTNPTIVVLGGGILFSLGLFLSSILPNSNPELIYLTYGVIAGLGVGAAYTSIISCAQRWYPDRKGFATGVIVCAFGLSTVIFAPIGKQLLKTMEVHDVFRTFSIVFLVVILLCFSFIQNPKADGNVKSELAGVAPSEMVKSWTFYVLALSLGLGTMLFFYLNPLILDLAKSKGITESVALTGVMIFGIANASGRLIAPALSDKIGYKSTIISLLSLTLLGSLACIFVEGNLFLVIIFFIALAYGGFSGIFPIATVINFGPKNIGFNYGLVMIGFATSALATPYIGKALTKKTDGVNDLTLFFIATAIGCLLAVLMISSIKKKSK